MGPTGDWTTVTRAKDVIKTTDLTWLGSSNTIISKHNSGYVGTANGIWALPDGTNDNRVSLFQWTDGKLYLKINTGGTTVAEITVDIAPDTFHPLRSYLLTMILPLIVNGVLVGTDTSGAVPAGLNVFYVGCGWDEDAQLNSHLLYITNDNTRLSNATAQALTVNSVRRSILPFAATKSLIARVGPDIVHTRVSGGTRVDEFGITKTVLNNQPRFTHDPVTLTSLGLLVEVEQTSTIRDSENQANSAWAKPGTQAISLGNIAPDGGEAWGMVEIAGVSYHYMYENSPATTTGLHTQTVYFRPLAAGGRWLSLFVWRNTSDYVQITVDPDTGLATTAPQYGTSSTITDASFKSRPAGNGLAPR